MWSLLADGAVKALRTRCQVWRNSFGKIQGQGLTVQCIPPSLPSLHDRHQSSVNGCGWSEAGVGQLLDLGAEDLIPAHPPFIVVSRWATAASCISLHLAVGQTRYQAPHAACRRFLSAALQLLDIAPILPVWLADNPGRSRILGSQTVKAPRPCSWQLVTSIH
jgi:hypothetical protein